MQRHTVVTLALVCLLCQTGFAQTNPEKAMQSREALRAYKASLKLTPEQNAKIKEIRRKYALQQEAVWKRFDADLAPFRGGGDKSPEGQARRGKIMAKVNAALAPVLAAQRKEEESLYTPEQKKLADAWRKAHPESK